MTLIGRLQRNNWVNAAVKYMKVDRVIGRYLQHFPLVRRIEGDIVYKVRSVPALVVANEIFSTDVYRKVIEIVKPKSFVDLGANVGFFPLLLASIVKSRDIRGLLVEPNPELVVEIQENLKNNGLEALSVLEGVVGSSTTQGNTDFYINPAHIASSITGNFNPAVPVVGKIKKISVPIVELQKEWDSRFGNLDIDLMKIDIEGAEVQFLTTHAELLRRTSSILIEWHKWITSLDEVTQIVKPLGFRLQKVTQEDHHAGTAFFKKVNLEIE